MTPFACIVIDPPWMFKDKLPGKSRGAAKNYRVEKLDRLKRMLVTRPDRDGALLLPPIADDAFLFMWRVSAMVPEAYELVRAMDFNHKSEIVWNKLTKHGKKAFGMGRTVRGAHETCIIAKRGRPRRLSGSIRSTFEAPVGEHSEKPDAFYALVEALCGGPRLEVFGRKARPGWTVIGDQAPGGKLLEVRP